MSGMAHLAATSWALVGSCHPVPSVAVTAFATALAASAGNSAATCVMVAVALLAGQLSIGWSNDRIDVGLDRSAERADKPVSRGDLDVRLVDRAIAAAVLVTVAASLALGWRAGVLHLFAVACGWLYNLGLKTTWFSWLPYAVAFAIIPGIATLALPAHPAPAGWAVGAGALLGITAHLTNALPDLQADRAFGVRGFPHRVGARPALLIATAAMLAGSALLVLGPPGHPSALRWAGLAVAAGWTVVGSALAWRRPDAPWAFYGTVAIAGLDVILLTLGPAFG
jgi:4-hydroxybenzoate polyprenyltransferase